MGSPPIEKLRELLWRGHRGSLVAQVQQAEPPRAAEFLSTLPFEEQQAIFAQLTPERAAQVTIALPYYHAYVLLHSIAPASMRAIIDRIDPTAWSEFLDELPEETWRAMMEELAPSLAPAAPIEASGPVASPVAPSAPAPAEGEVPQSATPQTAATPTVQPVEEAPAAPPETHEAIIEAQKIQKSFAQPDGRKILVIAPLDLSVESGSITALLGPSGSGKSTLLRMLSGLAQPSEGVVLWHKRPIAECRPNAAIVFQSFALFPWLTVLENVEAPLLARGMHHADRHARALRALNTVGLEGFETAYPKELSGGMKQRVGLARALAVEPEVLFMDEPFSALDVLTAENLRREIVELWQNKKMPTRSIFLVTHNIEEAVQLADRILVLGRNPATVRADFCVPLAQPRDRKSAAFLLYVDYIYKIMTQPELTLAPPSADAVAGRPRPQSLPHTRPGSIAGLLELVADRGGEEDLYHVAEELLLDTDDLLPILDGAALLGFATAGEGDVKITPEGRAFAEASIPARKVLFRDAALAHVTLLQQMKSALEKKSDHKMPLEFFRDVLDEHFSREDTERQVETALNWGIYAELFRYHRATDTIRLPKQRGAAAAALAQDELHE